MCHTRSRFIKKTKPSTLVSSTRRRLKVTMDKQVLLSSKKRVYVHHVTTSSNQMNEKKSDNDAGVTRSVE